MIFNSVLVLIFSQFKIGEEIVSKMILFEKIFFCPKFQGNQMGWISLYSKLQLDIILIMRQKSLRIYYNKTA